MTNNDLLEEALVKLESAANFMRGMAMFDKRLLPEIAESILNKVNEIDEFTEKAQMELNND